MKFQRIWGWLAVGILIVGLAWRIPWVFRGWRDSPLDRAGIWFAVYGLVLLGGCLFFFRDRGGGRESGSRWMGLAVAMLAVMGAGYSALIDFRFPTVVFLLAGLWGAGLWGLGWHFGLPAVSVFLCLLLAVPGSSFLLEMFRAGAGLPGGSPFWQLAIAAAAAGWVVLCWGVARFRGRPMLGVGQAVFLALCVAVAVLLSLPRLEQGRIGPGCIVGLSNFHRDGWMGAEVALAPAEAGFFRHADAKKAVFYSGSDAPPIYGLFVQAGGDIHVLHAPEYCLLGSGWRLDDRWQGEVSMPQGSVPVTWVKTSRGRTTMVGFYWFSNGVRSTGSLTSLRSMREPGEGWRLHFFSSPVDAPVGELGAGLKSFIEQGRVLDNGLTYGQEETGDDQ